MKFMCSDTFSRVPLRALCSRRLINREGKQSVYTDEPKPAHLTRAPSPARVALLSKCQASAPLPARFQGNRCGRGNKVQPAVTVALTRWRLSRTRFLPGRPCSVCLLLLVLVQITMLAVIDRNVFCSWEIIDPGRDRRSGTGPQLSDSLRVFLQETSAFKQQNPGKFCLLVCSLCTFFAVMGRYIPGIVISYFAVLAVFLWPLVSSHEVGLWLKPVLQKLDFGIGDFLQKLKENRERRVLQAEREGIESDLSSMFPKLDSTACKEMSVSDTEASDVTWTDTGTFNLSEGHTPQTETSDDLDREEAFSGGLPEFPSLDNGATTNGDDDDDLDLDLDLGLDLHLPAARRRHRARSEPAPPAAALGVVGHMAGEAIAAAVSAAMQEQIEAAVSSMAPSSGLLELDDESDSDAEDFELLDQSELEQLEGELGLGEKKDPARAEEGDEPASPGFLSRLLRRH